MDWLLFIVNVVVWLPIVFSADTYDLYSGKPLSDRRRNYLNANNALPQCTVEVEPCDPKEGRRVDGTCNNLKHPSRGSTKTPMQRLLPADPIKSRNPYLSKSGEELPLVREIRTSLFSDGLVNSPPFTALATHFFVHATVDIASLNDILTYIVVSDCCLGNAPNRANPRCIPIEVPADDPYLRLTGIRCMNLTRNTAYQDIGCVPQEFQRDRVSEATPLQDLSIIYGNTNAQAAQTRNGTGGLLRYEIRNNRMVPPGNSSLCVNNNRLRGETQCYEYGDTFNGNALIGINLIAVWFYREHNRIARRLQEINPCWGDERLYREARNINIAQWLQIYYYELIPALIGYDNAVRSGIIHQTKDYVDDYDPKLEPTVFAEFPVVTRFFHTFQDDRTKRYSHKKEYLGNDVRQVEFELRSGVLEVNRTLEELTTGSWVQAAAKFDYIFDPDLSERLFALQQAASDLISIDIIRGRDAALQTYNDYRELCGLPRAVKWDDFHDTIDKYKVEIISRLYDEPDDVDINVGIYAERFIKDGWVGPTLYCIMEKQLLHWRKSDRFFYEHGDQPSSLTLHQLNSIRKASIARVLCDSGDEVTKIQPQAFFVVKDDNEVVTCSKIQSWGFKAWEDKSCRNVTFQDGAVIREFSMDDKKDEINNEPPTIPQSDKMLLKTKTSYNPYFRSTSQSDNNMAWPSKPSILEFPSYDPKSMMNEQSTAHY